MHPLGSELAVARPLAETAGRLILEVFAGEFDVEHKPFEGPVTIADRRADELIRNRLAREFPDDAILSEETPDDVSRLHRRRLWLVDPLDGTRQFVARLPEFAVMIGLAIDGHAALGVVHLPAERLTCAGIVGVGAWSWRDDGPAQVLTLPALGGAAPRRAAVSRHHAGGRVERIIDRLAAVAVPSGSVGRKAALVALGAVDLYVTLGERSQHWDACAPEALVRAAGGFFGTSRGETITYNTAATRNRDGLVACRAGLRTEVLDAIRLVVGERG